MMKILFIATGYLPYTFSENLCNGKLVYALQQIGWEVDVLSKIDEGPAYSSDWQTPWFPLKEHCIQINYPVGNRFHRFVDILYSSVKMGTSAQNGIRWARRAYEKALLLHAKNHYDAILTRSPSDISHLVGLRFAKKTGVRWIANWNDPASTIWPAPYMHRLSPSRIARMRKYEISCLGAATINTFPSQSLLEHFISNYPLLKDRPTRIIPHIALPETLIEIKKRIRRDKLYMCHSGNLSSERNPEFTFQALRELINEGHTKIRLDIMGYMSDNVKMLIDKYQLTDHVRSVGSYPYMQALDKMQGYDILVLLEAKLEKGIFFPSKFTDYAQLRRPILAISPKVGFASDTLQKYGGGIAVDNENMQDIKRGILNLYRAWENNTLERDYCSEGIYQFVSADAVSNLYKDLLA